MSSRRDFFKKTSAVGAGITLLPSFTISGLGHKAPSDKLNIVGVGIGGKGFANLKAMGSENIIGLCDVDWKYAEQCFNEFPKAKRYKDWRKMFEELDSSFDAVMISTPDHTHAIIAATAITLGKHVYCQKPLTHSVYESRLLSNLAKNYKVATQMGNQGNSSDDVRQLCEWIWNGEIGEVREVHTYTNRPIWPQGLQKPATGMKIPETLDWDAFIGPAPMRQYHDIYHPWNWRGWWDFGTGAFGDMACHIIDPAYQALKLGFPEKVQGSSTKFNTESAPQAETVEYAFPGRDNLPGVAMPPVNLYWYDGGLLPMRLDMNITMEDGMGGCLFVGSKDSLICNTGGLKPRLLSGSVPRVEQSIRRIPGYTKSTYIDGPHEQDWIRACKESPEYRTETSSNFSYAGPFNEMVLLGVLAVRLQSLNKPLEWDADNMKFTNIAENEILKVLISDDFVVKDGHPRFNNKFAEFNALEAASEYIRRTYRKGWSLPDML
jgi:predicted dehydrogenase